MALRVRRRQGGSPTRRATTGTVVGPSRARIANPALPGFSPPRPPATNRGFGVGHGTAAPIPSIGARATVAAPTASYAPVAPAGPTSIAPPQGASSVAMRANAEQALQGANNNYRDSLFRAIMNLGDTSQFAKYQADPMFAGYQFSQDPNSAFAQLQRQQDTGLKTVDQNANAGNTFFSGQRLTDRQNLTNEADYQRLGASNDFLDNLRTLASALTGAQGDYRQNIADADQSDIDARSRQPRSTRWRRTYQGCASTHRVSGSHTESCPAASSSSGIRSRPGSGEGARG
jgi:hypothetical protein